MKILFVQIPNYSKVDGRSVYSDLIRFFKTKGHDIYVVTSFERRNNKKTSMYVDNGVHILGVKTLNMTKTGSLEKGLAYLTAEMQYTRAIKKFFSNVRFDLVIYTTPCFLISTPISYIMKKDHAGSYLLLKDIFPQNAVDLGMLSENGILNKYFRRKEILSYKVADYIGCMSPRNVEFLLEMNKNIDPRKVEICPNSIELGSELHEYSQEEKQLVRKRYNLPSDKIIYIYGGNIGAPQGIPFLMNAIKASEENIKAYFLIVGNGTYYKTIEKFVEDQQPNNLKLIKALPQDEYNNLVKACDVGIIALDYRFTIPNYPSRLLSYLQNAIPIIAATDMSCDTGTIAEENGYGFFTPSNSIESFVETIKKYTDHPEVIKPMGRKGYEYLKDHYLVDQSYDIIMSHYQE